MIGGPSDIPLVSLENISRSFGSVQANKDISLDIRPGRILALLGENGAGKSTLMSILAGMLRPDSGEIRIRGEKTEFHGPGDAIRAGIGMVYQHFMLVGNMSVAENIFLGQVQSAWLHPEAMEDRVSRLSSEFGLDIDPVRRVSELSMGEKQRVEILKLLLRQNTVLILDEPTSVLTSEEITQLFSAVKKMRSQGKAVVFISHKLEEVLRIADDVAILRRGRVMESKPVAEISSRAELARKMVGRDVLFQVEREEVPLGDKVLEINGLSDEMLKDIHLEVRRGEILAVVGVAGNGQKSLVEQICGLKKRRAGEIRLLGRNAAYYHRPRVWRDGLVHIPKDRLGTGVCPGLDLGDNFLLTTRFGFKSGPFLRRKEAVEATRSVLTRFDVRSAGPQKKAASLSGGNLQKFILGREFYRSPRLIVAEQPTQGLDVAATEDVWDYLLQARKNAGIILVTGDIREAMALSDRIAVLYGGRVMADVFSSEDRDLFSRLGPLMAGIEDEN
ncbi:MAG: ABC transporter ATP-binding protein [Desulfonatronovibrionaceae bacterium]